MPRLDVKLLFLFVYLSSVQLPLAIASNAVCPTLFAFDHQITYIGRGVGFDDPNMQAALESTGITRPNLFTEKEMDEFGLSNKEKYNITISQPKSSRVESGALWNPKLRGTVIDASSAIKSEKSTRLFDELESQKETGDINLMLLRDEEALPDSLAMEKFVNQINKEIHISSESTEYISSLLREMILSGRLASTGKANRLVGFRLRWKHDGKGEDYDVVHKDYTDFASTLAIVGSGTEIFYIRGKKIEVFMAQKGQISHIRGRPDFSDDSAKLGVLHRSSTAKGPRVVILVFWRNPQLK